MQFQQLTVKKNQKKVKEPQRNSAKSTSLFPQSNVSINKVLLINDLSNTTFKATFSPFSYIHLLEDLWCWQDVLHLSSHFVNMSSSRVTGTTGHIREILYTFCSVLNQQLLSPKQRPCDRVSALWSSQKPGALLRRVKRGVKGDPHRLQCHFHILAVAPGSSVKRYTNT